MSTDTFRDIAYYPEEELLRMYEELYKGQSESLAHCAMLLEVKDYELKVYWHSKGKPLRDKTQAAAARKQRGQPWRFPPAAKQKPASGPVAAETPSADRFLVPMPAGAPAPEMELVEAAKWFREVNDRVRAMREELAGLPGVKVSGSAKVVFNLQIEVGIED